MTGRKVKNDVSWEGSLRHKRRPWCTTKVWVFRDHFPASFDHEMAITRENIRHVMHNVIFAERFNIPCK